MEITKTVTTIFMAPTLKIPKDALKENGFLNAFVKDLNKDIQYENAVYLLFHPKDADKFREFLDGEYERTKDIIEDYDYPSGFVVVVYKLNPLFKEDFGLIRRGKYSQTSPDFQIQFPKVIKIIHNGLHRDEISLQVRVFKKTEDMVKYWEEKLGVTFSKTQEVWEGFDEKKEVLTKEILDIYEKGRTK